MIPICAIQCMNLYILILYNYFYLIDNSHMCVFLSKYLQDACFCFCLSIFFFQFEEILFFFRCPSLHVTYQKY